MATTGRLKGGTPNAPPGYLLAHHRCCRMLEHLNTKSAEDLIEAGREFYRRGWVLGTSGNFSMLTSREPTRICVTASGGDKGKLDDMNFLELDDHGKIVSGFGRPSAETVLHQTIYRCRPQAGSV